MCPWLYANRNTHKRSRSLNSSASACAAEIAAAFKDLGFAYVTLDLFGYRTGSMNEVLHGNH